MSLSHATVVFSSLLVFAACGSDKVDGFVDPSDTDATVEIFLPDSTPDTTPLELVEVEADGSNEEALCPGCTGAPCEGNGDCNSGYCLEAERQGVRAHLLGRVPGRLRVSRRDERRW